MPQRPNVLLFCVDEMRADHLGCAGNPLVKTPNLDALAARGTLFRRSYCGNPICMPARASMFTGMLPRDHGLRVNGQWLRSDLPTLPGVLAAGGYRTHSAGKLHLTPWINPPGGPEDFPEAMDHWDRPDRPAPDPSRTIQEFPEPYYGFQSVDFVGGHGNWVWGEYFPWLRAQGGDATLLQPNKALRKPSGAPTCFQMALPQEVHYNQYIADSTIKLIRESARADAPPFFAWCSFPDPHMPLCPPAPYCHWYNPADMPLPAGRAGELDSLPPVYRDVLDGKLRPNGIDNRNIRPEQYQEMIALTYAMVSHVDVQVGRVLAALTQAGLSDNTIVVFLSDHGDMMGDHGLLWKAFYTFRGCIEIPTIVAAPGMPGGNVCRELISHVDLLPSLLDLCGLSMPGADWIEQKTPYSRGSVQELRTYPGRSWRPLLAGSTASARAEVVIENDDPTTGLRPRVLVTKQHRLCVYPGMPWGELFDLERDPQEVHNLWAEPGSIALRSELTARLLAAYSADTPLYPIPPSNA